MQSWDPAIYGLSVVSLLDFATEIPYLEHVHTVVETPAFLHSAEAAGISDNGRWEIVTMLANNPELGDLIQGTGGCRKFRVAGRSKGKSGGYRIITFYSGRTVPVFLLAAFGKGEKANLSDAECNSLRNLTKVLVSAYGKKVVSLRRKK